MRARSSPSTTTRPRSGTVRARDPEDAEEGVSSTQSLRGRGVRPWTLAIVLSVLMVGAALAALATIPIAQSTAFSFSIHDPGSATVNSTHSLTFAHTGTFGFSWTTGARGVVNFTVHDSSGRKSLYFMSGSSASGSVAVLARSTYLFEVTDLLSVTVSVSGNLSFSAPVLFS